jgi:GNAT superfamily N-acetyltransferase
MGTQIQLFPWEPGHDALNYGLQIAISYLHDRPATLEPWFVVGVDNNRVCGALQFGIRRRGADVLRLHACGTRVAKSRRRKGLATAMWVYAIETFRPKTIYVETVSKGGTFLIERLKLRYPEIRWDHEYAQDGILSFGLTTNEAEAA